MLDYCAVQPLSNEKGLTTRKPSAEVRDAIANGDLCWLLFAADENEEAKLFGVSPKRASGPGLAEPRLIGLPGPFDPVYLCDVSWGKFGTSRYTVCSQFSRVSRLAIFSAKFSRFF